MTQPWYYACFFQVKKEKEKDGYNDTPMSDVATPPVTTASSNDKKEKPLRMSTRQTRKDTTGVDDAGVDDVSMRSMSVDRAAKSPSPPAATASSRRLVYVREKRRNN